jgi:hypothetical protein
MNPSFALALIMANTGGQRTAARSGAAVEGDSKAVRCCVIRGLSGSRSTDQPGPSGGSLAGLPDWVAGDKIQVITLAVEV